jgi:DNA-binding CsgD family transcriptional regulator
MTTSILSQAGSEWSYREPATKAVPSAEDDGLRLSDREHEIMHWVGCGKTNHEIGMILGISQFTVKNHLQRIFRKIDVRNRAQAITRLLALGQTTQQLQ